MRESRQPAAHRTVDDDIAGLHIEIAGQIALLQDASVVAIRRGNAARRAAELLVAAYRRGEATGSVAWEDLNLAYETALLAVD